MIIFFRADSNFFFFRRLLSVAKIWICDGTFDYAPALFSQLYTIHGYVNGFNIPLAYFRLPCKSQPTYERMFRMLNEVAADVTLQPECIMMDFEQAALNAANAVFPLATLRGCKFHFTQAIVKRIEGERILCECYEKDGNSEKGRPSLTTQKCLCIVL